MSAFQMSNDIKLRGDEGAVVDSVLFFPIVMLAIIDVANGRIFNVIGLLFFVVIVKNDAVNAFGQFKPIDIPDLTSVS